MNEQEEIQQQQPANAAEEEATEEDAAQEDKDGGLGGSFLTLMDPVFVHRNTDLRQETVLEGIVAYLGSVGFADGSDWVGVRLTGTSQGLGKNNGTVQGLVYFDALPNCGIFVRQAVVERRILTKRQEIQLRRDLGVHAAAAVGVSSSSPPSRISTSRQTTPGSSSPRKVSNEQNPRSQQQQQADTTAVTVKNYVTPDTEPDVAIIAKQTMARTPFIRKNEMAPVMSTPPPRSTPNENSANVQTMTTTPNIVDNTSNVDNNDDSIAYKKKQTMARTPIMTKFASSPDTATKKEVQAWIRELAEPKIPDTATKKEVQAWIQDLASATAVSTEEPALLLQTSYHHQHQQPLSPMVTPGAAANETDDDTMVLPDMAAENKPVRLWGDNNNNEISPTKSVIKNVIDIQQQLPSSPSIQLLSTETTEAAPSVLLQATTPRKEQGNDNGVYSPQHQQQQRDREQREQQPDYSYTLPAADAASTTTRQERLAYHSPTNDAGEQPASTAAFTSPRWQQQQQEQVRTRQVLANEPSSLTNNDMSEMTKCQAWITLLLMWINIFPILGLAGILLWKPSLLFPHYEDEQQKQDNNNAGDEKATTLSFVTLLSGGLLLGQTLCHIMLLLPLTGDCLCACYWWCCCCCCSSSSSLSNKKGVKTFSVNASRMAAVGTAWTGLVLLLSTSFIMERETPRPDEQANDDDNDDTPLLILLSASGMTLVLSCLSLMISFLPCSSRKTSNEPVSAAATNTAGSRRTALLEPLLAATSDEEERDEEAPGPITHHDDTNEQAGPPPTSRLKGTRRLLQLASSQVFYLYSGCLVLLIRLPFSISIPHFVSTAISALAQGQFERARHQVFYLLILGSIDAALDFWGFFLFGYANLRIVRDLRLDLFWRLLHMEVGFFDINNTGALSSRLNNDCSAMAGDLTWFFRFSIESVVRITGITAYMLIRSPRLGACALCIIPIVAAVNKCYGSWLSKNASAVQEALAQANAVAQEALINVRTVIAFAAEEEEHRRYDEKIEDQYQLNVKQLFMQSVYYMAISTFLINTVVQSALLWIGAYMIERHQLTAEVLLAFMLYQGQLQSETLNLFQSYTSLIQSSGAGEKVFALLDRTPPPPAMGSSAVEASRQREDDEGDNSAVAVQQRSSHTLQLQQVTFRYPSRPQKKVLNQFDLEIPQGTTCALVGASGAGKSTIVHLLQRFYDPSAGAILVDGVDLRRLDLQLHRRSIGVVTQDCVLFDGTVLDNIMFGSSRRGEVSSAERHEAIRAAELAHVDIFVREFAQGYDTPVGEGGVQLSGGQKQRIAIARAIYKKPSLLLLDEATSNLDSQSEQIVQRALDELLQRTGDNMTTVVIAHRLKTVQNADLIAVLGSKEGRIVECGTHQELVQKRDGIYRTMVQRASTSGILPENVEEKEKQ